MWPTPLLISSLLLLCDNGDFCVFPCFSSAALYLSSFQWDGQTNLFDLEQILGECDGLQVMILFCLYSEVFL